MNFLIESDYFQIKKSHLNSISPDESDLEKAEDSAIEKVKGYLRGKFDVTKAFPIVTNWDDEISYVIDDVVLWNDVIWIALQDNTDVTPGTDPLVWEQRDPRNPVLVEIITYLTLCKITDRVQPGVNGKFDRDCKEAKELLKAIADGTFDLNLPPVDDDDPEKRKGGMMVYSKTPNDWYY